MGFIYLRTNNVNGKKYVGQATNLKTRQNKWNNLSEKYAGKAINAARAKYGLDAFGFEILKECDDKELDFWEKYYIKELNTKIPYGYNMTDGGGGRAGCPVSSETRMKMSEANKGKTPWMKGKHHSEKTRKKLSELHKGKKHSEETKRKIGKIVKNRKITEETKKKLSKLQKGKNNSFYGKHHTEQWKEKISKRVLQIDKGTNEIMKEFPSTMEVQKQLGYNQSGISNCCLGKQKTAYGYIWQYKESVA